VGAGDSDERTAIAARQVRGIDVSGRATQLDALSQQEAHGGEDGFVNGLVGFIVGQLQADGIA